MAFPATYDIRYYMGDTHEFKIYPKDSSGAVFPLAEYSSVQFTISERRGTPLPTDSPPVQGYAVFSNDRTNIACAITPANSTNLDPSKTYVYDVKISKTGSPYNSVFTLLTGKIAIEDRVIPPVAPVVITAPGIVTGLSVTDTTSSSITVGWSAPSTGSAPLGYFTYIIPHDPSFENTIALAAISGALSDATPFEAETTSYTFTSTTAVASLGIPSLPLLPETAYIYAVVAYNQAGSGPVSGNFNLTAGTIDEVFTDGGS
jgi:hypothetical protein